MNRAAFTASLVSTLPSTCRATLRAWSSAGVAACRCLILPAPQHPGGAQLALIFIVIVNAALTPALEEEAALQLRPPLCGALIRVAIRQTQRLTVLDTPNGPDDEVCVAVETPGAVWGAGVV
eukprot:CAMPEP_0196734284 /NCGR_PEP_ID=MMETSP1091-20130531/13067_1 /TAXON_ID=302021 /ORGANISM="Rhodomonas sp., Strain CCMP768" /LENGTH=121 /DNA_ID=CAMNT_0042077769 /DNA_START=309 /DNA_END=673 /DNA_ORIENTATION=-